MSSPWSRGSDDTFLHDLSRPFRVLCAFCPERPPNQVDSLVLPILGAEPVSHWQNFCQLRLGTQPLSKTCFPKILHGIDYRILSATCRSGAKVVAALKLLKRCIKSQRSNLQLCQTFLAHCTLLAVGRYMTSVEPCQKTAKSIVETSRVRNPEQYQHQCRKQQGCLMFLGRVSGRFLCGSLVLQ